jgi:hypothetical protein
MMFLYSGENCDPPNTADRGDQLMGSMFPTKCLIKKFAKKPEPPVETVCRLFLQFNRWHFVQANGIQKDAYYEKKDKRKTDLHNS